LFFFCYFIPGNFKENKKTNVKGKSNKPGNRKNKTGRANRPPGGRKIIEKKDKVLFKFRQKVSTTRMLRVFLFAIVTFFR